MQQQAQEVLQLTSSLRSWLPLRQLIDGCSCKSQGCLPYSPQADLEKAEIWVGVTSSVTSFEASKSTHLPQPPRPLERNANNTLSFLPPFLPFFFLFLIYCTILYSMGFPSPQFHPPRIDFSHNVTIMGKFHQSAIDNTFFTKEIG